jgi:hypothetical protein
MSIPLMADIVEAVPAVKCVKLESTPTAARTRQLINTMTGRPGILNRPTILTGLGGLYGVPPPFTIRMPSVCPLDCAFHNTLRPLTFELLLQDHSSWQPVRTVL